MHERFLPYPSHVIVSIKSNASFGSNGSAFLVEFHKALCFTVEFPMVKALHSYFLALNRMFSIKRDLEAIVSDG